MGTERIVRKICFVGNFIKLEEIVSLAKKLGYPMFAFNEMIYCVPNKTDDDLLSLPLGFSTEDLGV